MFGIRHPSTHRKDRVFIRGICMVPKEISRDGSWFETSWSRSNVKGLLSLETVQEIERAHVWASSPLAWWTCPDFPLNDPGTSKSAVSWSPLEIVMSDRSWKINEQATAARWGEKLRICRREYSESIGRLFETSQSYADSPHRCDVTWHSAGAYTCNFPLSRNGSLVAFDGMFVANLNSFGRKTITPTVHTAHVYNVCEQSWACECISFLLQFRRRWNAGEEKPTGLWITENGKSIPLTLFIGWYCGVRKDD